MTASELICLIEDAWHKVPYPGDDRIFTPDSYDDEGIVSYFGGTTWRGHDPANLRAHSSAFTFFTPEAFHFWLPAFMIAAIMDREEADVVLDRITWSINDRFASQRWPLFSLAQRHVVAEYLHFRIETFSDEGVEDEREALCILEAANEGRLAAASLSAAT